MSFGVVLLCHTALDRAAQVARFWAEAGCPVVVHVDRIVPQPSYAELQSALADLPDVHFGKRFRCDWGTWGLVAASQDAAAHLLDHYPNLRHVYLASGACLPLRPIAELRSYLDARPHIDFIESATTADVPWTMGGLDEERFTLHFPVSWRRHRRLFDKLVSIQRSLGIRRKIPGELVPHMGSQWWCLTRKTLRAILDDPDRPRFERYFRRVWIPDESYFQTLARRHATQIESRSLTLSKFDFQGKPHIFYDDHLQLLRRSDCFVARKVWPHADRLYQAFLTKPTIATRAKEPNPGKINRVFSKAVDQRTRGRPGLYMQSRYPNPDWENGVTPQPYGVFCGFDDLFEGFGPWLAQTTGTVVHGHLFAPERAEFVDGHTIYKGALSDNATLRDAYPRSFWTNFLWNTRDTRHCFQFGPQDRQDIVWDLAKDPNAKISVVSGAWAVRLFRSHRDFAELRSEAAQLQKTETEMLAALRSPYAKTRAKIWSLADFLDAPLTHLQSAMELVDPSTTAPQSSHPALHDLKGFVSFLQDLKNQGVHLHVTGDFPIDTDAVAKRDTVQRKPYLIR